MKLLLNILWRKRFLRAWLAVALPLALTLAYLAYLAYASNAEASRAKSYAQEWQARALDRERQGISKGTFSQDPGEEAARAYSWMSDAEKDRDKYITAVAALLLLAPAGVLLLFVGAWVWGDSNPQVGARTPSDR